jgi:hypothetical protein
MIRELQVFETADGKRHDCASKAAEHVTDAVREYLDGRLADLQKAGKLSANDRFTIVTALVPDSSAAHDLHRHLARWMDY